MNIQEDLHEIENAVGLFRRHDEVDAYRIVQPAETALRQSCERMEHIEEQRAKNCYHSDLLPEIKKFVNALKQYTQNQDFQSLRTDMKQIQEALKDFNRSVDYLIRTGLVREDQQTVIIIPQNQQEETASVPPLKRKTKTKQKNPEAPKQEQPRPQPVKKRTVPARKTLEEIYFSSSGTDSKKDEKKLNKNIEAVIKITAEDPDSGSLILQYYLANKNAFRRKEIYPHFWDRISRKNKIITYQQAFRVSDWKPLFPENHLPDEYISLAKNIFGVPREGNLQDDGLLLRLFPDSLKISFKTYGERTSKSLTSEFSGQTQQSIELARKDFTEKENHNSCHYHDMISFYHQFNHVESELNQKEVLVKIKLDIRLHG
ncbi:MAG: hypothetical protein IJ642_09020 [Oscillospiraceae bacterium]|nr:hypothetical protein [Oscillospiraceae bacterium]